MNIQAMVFTFGVFFVATALGYWAGRSFGGPAELLSFGAAAAYLAYMTILGGGIDNEQ